MALQTVIGMMSGTSLDGIDVAMIRTDGATAIEPGPSKTYPYEAAARAAIRGSLGREKPDPAAVDAVTRAHGAALSNFMAETKLSPGQVDWIGFHGQTTFHDPDNRVSVQIGDAASLANAVGIPVVSDFRSADVKAGGQGAPLAPLYHAARASALDKPLAVLNLGGVANVTWIGAAPAGAPVEAQPLLAFDTGPANALLDDWVMARSGRDRDEDGRLAAAGQADEDRLAAWLRHPYFDRKPPKSLDRDAFNAAVAGLSLEDGAATLTEFTVRSVARAAQWLPAPPTQWIVTGGGRHNPEIMRRLNDRLGCPVRPVESAGWDGDALEAQAFAWLAVRVVEKLPTSVPGTTGVPAPTTGGQVNKPV